MCKTEKRALLPLQWIIGMLHTLFNKLIDWSVPNPHVQTMDPMNCSTINKNHHGWSECPSFYKPLTKIIILKILSIKWIAGLCFCYTLNATSHVNFNEIIRFIGATKTEIIGVLLPCLHKHSLQLCWHTHEDKSEEATTTIGASMNRRKLRYNNPMAYTICRDKAAHSLYNREHRDTITPILQ